MTAVPLAAAVFLGPAANAALFGYQAAVTPDHLQGRVVSVILLAATSAAALAPALAGLLLAHVTGRTAMLVFPLLVAVAAVAASSSSGIRSMSRRAVRRRHRADRLGLHPADQLNCPGIRATSSVPDSYRYGRGRRPLIEGF